MDKIIEFRDNNFTYKDGKGFKDFNLEIESGDIVSLIGPSGSGKTTLLKMLCHKLPNDSVYFEGNSIVTVPLSNLRQNLVVIFDTPFNGNNIFEELSYYMKQNGYIYNDMQNRVDDFVNLFDLKSIEYDDINKLSMDKKNLIKILRYLILSPKFIAIDGLLSGLDKINKQKIIDYIRNKKITLLNVTSDLKDTIYGDKIFVLDEFVTILEGSTLSVLKTDTLLKRLGFTIPTPIELSIELINYQVLDKIYTDEEDLVNALWK